jgi:hypothetical protein
VGFTLEQTTVHVCDTKEKILSLANMVDNMGGSGGERAEKEAREAWLKAKAMSGESIRYVWDIARVGDETDGKRVNGQHTSRVFLSLTDEEWTRVPLPVTIILSEYRCDTPKDISILFEQFDDIRSARTKPDKIGAHLVHYPQLQAVLKDRDVAVKLTQGLTFYAQRVLLEPVTDESQFGALHRNHDTHTFLMFAGQFLSKRKTRELLHPPILAAMYHTTRFETSNAQDFWLDVSLGKEHLDADSIAYKLAEFFEQCDTHDYKWPANILRQVRGGKRPSERDIFATALRAFRAWRDNRKVGEIFTAARDRKIHELVQEFYPFPVAHAAE